VSEQTKTKEVTKVDRFVSSFVNEETGHQYVNVTQSNLSYNEHEKSEQSHLVTPESVQPIGIEKGAVEDKEHISQVVRNEDQTMSVQAKIVQASRCL